jgi:hypothetical protein
MIKIMHYKYFSTLLNTMEIIVNMYLVLFLILLISQIKLINKYFKNFYNKLFKAIYVVMLNQKP